MKGFRSFSIPLSDKLTGRVTGSVKCRNILHFYIPTTNGNPHLACFSCALNTCTTNCGGKRRIGHGRSENPWFSTGNQKKVGNKPAGVYCNTMLSHFMSCLFLHLFRISKCLFPPCQRKIIAFHSAYQPSWLQMFDSASQAANLPWPC